MTISDLEREREMIQIVRDAELRLIDRLLIRIQVKPSPRLQEDPADVEKPSAARVGGGS